MYFGAGSERDNFIFRAADIRFPWVQVLFSDLVCLLLAHIAAAEHKLLIFTDYS